MPSILIVEDEMLVACHTQDILEDGGHTVVGIAPDFSTAAQFFTRPIDLALVDLNLRDGLTGPQIGARLCSAGVRVVFITANPAQIGDGIPGAIGVLSKPTDEDALLQAVDYAIARDRQVSPPRALRVFA